MLLKYENDMLCAYDSYDYKDLLKSVGFRWNGRLRCWQITPSMDNLILFYNEFKRANVNFGDKKTKNLLKEAKLFSEKRNSEIKRLEIYKKELFNNPGNIDVSAFNIPDGITLYDHQKIALSYLYETPVGNLYGDCGVGKTAIMLLLTERLIREGKINKVLIVCTKAIMRTAWEKDAKKFAPNLDLVVLDKGSKVNNMIITRNFKNKHPKYKKKYDKEFHIYVINFESVPKIKDSLFFNNFDMMIIDEASYLKNNRAKMTKACVEISKYFDRKYVMSGLPAPNSELEYFPQMKIIDPLIFGYNFVAFRDKWFISSGFMGFEKTLNFNLRDDFISKIYTYGLRFRHEDCIDLPKTNDLVLEAYMNNKHSKLYKTLEKEIILELEDDTIPVTNPLTHLIKLRQLASGFALNEESETVELSNHKLDVLKEFLDSCGDKQVVIWAVFIRDIEKIKEMLGDDCLAIYGKTSKNISEISEKFVNKDVKYIVVNPRSAAHGITWVNANINVYYGLSFSPELYHQSRARTYRIGQKEPVFYYHILSRTADNKPTVDHVIYKAVTENLTNSMEIINAFKEIAL